MGQLSSQRSSGCARQVRRTKEEWAEERAEERAEEPAKGSRLLRFGRGYTQKIIFSANCVLYGSPEPMPGAPYETPMVSVLAPNKGPLAPMLGLAE
jgi:hypothetical protein